MKRSFLLLALVCGLATLRAENAPVTLTVKSFRALTNNIGRIVETARPGSGEMALMGIQGGLGIPQLKGIDLERPWQVQVWLSNGQSKPAVSVWIPTSDFDAFKGGLEEGVLKSGGDPKIRQVEKYAGVWIPGSAESKDGEAGHASWKPSQIGTPDRAVLLEFSPNDTMRQQILLGLAGARMMIAGAVGGQAAEQLGGMDPKAMAELLGVYFDVIETVIKGMQKLDLGIDLRGENLVVSQKVQAKAGTDLEGWMKASEGSLDSVLPYAAGTSPLTFAMRLNENPAFLPTMKKFIRLSLQMQGMAADSDAAKETEKLIEAMIPMKAAGVVDLKNGITMSGVYQFPGRDVGAVYRQLVQYLEKGMQSQVGEAKAYKAIKFQAAKRTSGGVKVDLVTMELNLDAPMYKMAGQREIVEKMWKGGKMEFEYAIKGDSLLFASPGLMDALIAGKAAASAPKLALSPKTLAYGQLNLIAVLPTMLEMNPMVPQEVKDRITKLDPAGTDMTARVDLDGTLSAEEIIPLKLISAFSKLDQ
jgi:hypothetical protein